MLINDEHRFAFIHIPKCAGTSIRHAIQPYDSHQGKFTDRVASHSVLGQLDYVHIPLFVLSEHFKNEFTAVQNYWSTAVVRDPFSRFASSVSQHLRNDESQAIHKLSKDEIRAVVDKSINYLSHQPRKQHLLPPRYIHFQRQVDYVELDGDCIVNSVYSLHNIDMLLFDISKRVGQDLASGHSNSDVRQVNKAVVFKNDIARRLIETTRPLTRHMTTFLPQGFKQKIRDVVYVPRDKRFKDVFETDEVKAFISDYYSEDISLYQRVLAANRR